MGKNDNLMPEEAFEGMDELHRLNTFIDRPAVAYTEWLHAADRYDRLLARCTGGAVRYDNPLGVRVQTSPGNVFEDRILDLTDAEDSKKMAFMLFETAYLTVRNIIYQTAELTQNQKKVVVARLNPNQPTYLQISQRFGLKNAAQARYLDISGQAKLANSLHVTAG